MFNLKDYQTTFPKWLNGLTFTLGLCKTLELENLEILFFLVKQCVVVVLICIFLQTNDVEHFPMDILIISLCRNVYFAHFKLGYSTSCSCILSVSIYFNHKFLIRHRLCK